MGKYHLRAFFLVAFIFMAHSSQAYPEAINAMQGLMGIEQADGAASAENVNNVTVTVITGRQETVKSKKIWMNPDWHVRKVETIYDGGGTDCSLAIKFCRDHKMNDCSKEFPLDTDGDDLEEGVTDVFNISRPASVTTEHRYFRITLKDNKCGDFPQWHMQGLRIKADDYTYYNPCVNKRLAPGDALDFGPGDTAVCAIVKTSGEDKSGTDDAVELVLKDGGSEYDVSRTRLDSLAPSIEEGASTDLFMLLSWGRPIDGKKSYAGYDDFEKSSVTSYGAYIFDSYPLSDQPDFFIKKANDRRKGGWLLEELEVFVFQPGEFLNLEEGTVFHRSVRPNVWLEDERGLIYPKDDSIKLDAVGSEIIKDSIGGHL